MMNAELTIPYYETQGLKMIDLPYGDSIYSMTIILPKANNTVDKIINNMDIVDYNNYIQNMYPSKMEVQMPKFKIEFKEYLKEILIGMGMEKAFSQQADFSGINGTGGLFIDDVIHQSFVEVDEKGTEAAAATVVIINESAAGNFFFANKPFVFVIRDNRTNSILFIGKMMNPTS